jgi:hypothetical protein
MGSWTCVEAGERGGEGKGEGRGGEDSLAVVVVVVRMRRTAARERRARVLTRFLSDMVFFASGFGGGGGRSRWLCFSCFGLVLLVGVWRDCLCFGVRCCECWWRRGLGTFGARVVRSFRTTAHRPP